MRHLKQGCASCNVFFNLANAASLKFKQGHCFNNSLTSCSYIVFQQFDSVLQALEDGRDVDLSNMPPPLSVSEGVLCSKCLFILDLMITVVILSIWCRVSRNKTFVYYMLDLNVTLK